MTYQYTSRLKEHEVRLLCPVSITHDRLEFRMITVQRSSAPTYSALSYAWGNEEPTEDIFLNGLPFKVRPNLWSCLFNLCGKMQTQRLWVDAVCINQKDDKEKSGQVKRMDKVYTGADNVAVWLGLPSICETRFNQVTDPAILKTCQVEDYEWYEDVEDLANRDYWSRYWVIQEMLLGRKIMIWCGNCPIDLPQFQERVCEEAGINEYSSRPHEWISKRHPALSLIMGRNINRYPGIQASLGHLLTRHRRSECKDARDRVFALIGIVHHEEAQWLLRFFPDYSLSEREVIVIALAHLTQVVTGASDWDARDIGVHSEELFEALRVPEMSQRRELLERAKRIDYLGCESVEEIRAQLSSEDILYRDDHSMDMLYEMFLPLADEDLFAPRRKCNCIIL